jgi:hypothetical protein
MKVPKLTPEEQAHVDSGGRVFIVDEAPGMLWRVLSVSQKGCTVLLKPDGAEGYIDRGEAHQNALMVANLANDSPMVRK